MTARRASDKQGSSLPSFIVTNQKEAGSLFFRERDPAEPQGKRLRQHTLPIRKRVPEAILFEDTSETNQVFQTEPKKYARDRLKNKQKTSVHVIHSRKTGDFQT